MSNTSGYQRFAWIAKYIVAVRPGENTLEFQFPPLTAGAKEAIEEMMAMKLPWFDVSRTTTWYCTFPHQPFFEFLVDEYNRIPGHTEFYVYFKFDMSALSLEDMSGVDEYYAEAVIAMEDGRLHEQLDAAIEREHYERAALIRDEIGKRAQSQAKLPFLQPLKWRS